MLHGMSANGIGLANTALVVSVIRGLISKGLIDRAEARLWLNNAATLIEEDKTAFTKRRGCRRTGVQPRFKRSGNSVVPRRADRSRRSLAPMAKEKPCEEQGFAGLL
jgi:hypothetical protein